MSDAYKPVPVQAAADIATKYEKSVVLIVAIDYLHDKTHFTTFGRTAQEKAYAAVLGDVVGKRITGFPKEACQTFEDFRLDAAKLKEQRDALLAFVRHVVAEPDDGALVSDARALLAKVGGL